MSKVEPCPFCGHPPCHRQIPNDGRWLTDCNTVSCIRPSTGIRRTEAEAIAAWNQRTDPATHRALGRAEGLNEAVTYLRDYAKEVEGFHSVVPGFLIGAADTIEAMIEQSPWREGDTTAIPPDRFAEGYAQCQGEAVAWLRTYPPVIGLSEMAAWNTAAFIERDEHKPTAIEQSAHKPEGGEA